MVLLVVVMLPAKQFHDGKNTDDKKPENTRADHAVSDAQQRQGLSLDALGGYILIKFFRWKCDWREIPSFLAGSSMSRLPEME